MTTILIIEDDREINRLIESTLISEGYSCDCAFDGKEGADRIEEKTYDLVLLDLMLPQISGYELLDYIVRYAGYHYFRDGPGERQNSRPEKGCGRLSEQTFSDW